METNPPSPLESLYQRTMALSELGVAVSRHYRDGELGGHSRPRSLRAEIADSVYADSLMLRRRMEGLIESEEPATRPRRGDSLSVLTKNLISYCNGLEHDGVQDKEYVRLLRREAVRFRHSLRKWLRAS